jgi:hypothetical protein
MSLFSLDWFKANKEKKKFLEFVEKVDKKLDNIDERLNQLEDTNYLVRVIPVAPQTLINLHQNDLYEKRAPYKSYKLVNDVLTVVLNDGTILQKKNATNEDFGKIEHAKSVVEIKDIIEDQEAKKVRSEERILEVENEKIKEENKINYDKAQVLINSGLFERKEHELYIKDIDRSLPLILIDAMVKQFNNKLKFKALLHFWYWCCLNPNARAAYDLYDFLQRGDFKINKYGCFFTYRRVVTVHGDKKSDSEYIDFITNAYNKVKGVWKKNPINFAVRTGEMGALVVESKYILVDLKKKGLTLDKGEKSLKELYDTLSTNVETTYTDNYTKQEVYRPNTTISMPRKQADGNNAYACSTGFHSGNKRFGYSIDLGDQQILVLTNPKDVVAVPQNSDKIRQCRWHFVMTLSKEEQFILNDDEFDTTNIGTEFSLGEIENVEKLAKESDVKDFEKNAIFKPLIPIESKNLVVKLKQSAEEIQEILASRIVAK